MTAAIIIGLILTIIMKTSSVIMEMNSIITMITVTIGLKLILITSIFVIAVKSSKI